MDKHKLGVIVPYRHREGQLPIFLSHISNYLTNNNIDYRIIIVDQDDAKQFNRGMLLNIGFKYAKSMRCDYVVFHDIDMLPIDVDYSYSEFPLHLATGFILDEGEKEREIFDEYFGGVTLFPIEVFEKIDGYSNKYWGWGYEDTDLLLRCKYHGIKLDKLKLKNRGKNEGKFIRFNGINSMIKIKNTLDYKSNMTVSITFYPDKLLLDHTKNSDEFTIFSVPGWDFAICYNSFSRYNFCIFDVKHNALFVNSEIKTNHKTNIIFTINLNEKMINVYQDGELIGELKIENRFYFYRKEPYFYLGVGNPNRENSPNYFVGYFESFAYFDEVLAKEEIKEISENDVYYLRKDFGDYKSSQNLKCYLDSNFINKDYKLTDLSGNNNTGEIFDCEVVSKVFDQTTEVLIPHRKKSTFKSLKHEENGFLGNRWKDGATRWNQLRFHNEVSNDFNLLHNDGISTLEFIEHGKRNDGKITHINVGI
jgi:hypothetical protein